MRIRPIALLRARLRSGRGAELLRYVFAGVGITLAAHGIYLLLLFAGQGPHVAWALSFVCGTVLGYIVHRRFVFRVRARRHHWVSFPLAYVLRFGIGQALLTLALWGGMSEGWAGFVVNVAMAPIGYLMLRLVLHERG